MFFILISVGLSLFYCVSESNLLCWSVWCECNKCTRRHGNKTNKSWPLAIFSAAQISSLHAQSEEMCPRARTHRERRVRSTQWHSARKSREREGDLIPARAVAAAIEVNKKFDCASTVALSSQQRTSCSLCACSRSRTRSTSASVVWMCEYAPAGTTQSYRNKETTLCKQARRMKHTRTRARLTHN